MRNLSMAVLLIVSLVAGPGYGTVMLWVDSTASSIPVGGTATVSLLAETTTGGVYSVGGYVVPSSQGVLANSNLWFNGGMGAFDGQDTPDMINGAWLPSNGNCGVNAWQDSPYNTSLGNISYGPVTVVTYTVTGVAPGTATLSWHDNGPGPIYGLVWTRDTSGKSNGGTAVGSATITVTPEPVSLALLAVGGLVLVRRRQV